MPELRSTSPSPPDFGSPGSPEDLYHRRLAAFTARADRWAGRSRALSFSRLIVFLAALGCGLWVLYRASEGTPTGWLLATVSLFAVFVALVLIHDRVIRRETAVRQLADLNREGLARLEHDWSALPEPGRVHLGQRQTHEAEQSSAELSLDLSPLARDLHLFGHASLFHLLGAHLSPPGRNTLARWLLEPAAAEEARRRQQAVAELRPRIELRQEVAHRASQLTEADADVEPFLAWAEGEPWLLPRRGLNVASFALPALTLGAFVAWGLSALPFAATLLLPWVNLAVSAWLGSPIPEIFDRISAREAPFQHYAAVLAAIEEGGSDEGSEGEGFESDWLTQRLADLSRSGLSASRQMNRLHQRVVLSDSRHSAPLNFILEALFLWSFHVLRRLERWQVQCGAEARRWLTALGEIEAVAALAGLAFDNPDWAFPEISEPAADRPAQLEAHDLAHPLLPRATRVANDLTIGPSGTFVLVTGSNMSGKSTLLRAVGVNVVLAQAGGPACARALRLPPLTLGTSILIEDSLEDGISFFLAELLRLREIVEAARRSRGEGRRLLYLLDEVLRGTNSRERRLAARRILRHLLDLGALGAISTHDPALLETEELAAVSRPVYFQETIHPEPDGKQVMTFDYKLRQGVNTGGNALKLLELVGLEDGDDRSVEMASLQSDTEESPWTT